MTKFLAPCLGFMLCLGGCAARVGNDPTIAELKTKALAGTIGAQVWLGSKYDRGDGVPQDYVEAAKWYDMAANSGDAIAQNSLGSLYQEGLGVAKDLAQALAWFQKAAVQGEPNAQCSLGLMYDTGQGVPQNPIAANAWYRKAAEQGFPTGMLNLGLSYAQGSGTQKDLVQAFMWLDLGRFYTQFSQDRTVKWRVRGALDELKKQMTPQQIREGEAMTRAWDQDFKVKHAKP